MRHDETPLQIFTTHPSGVPAPVVRPFRRREPTLPFRSAPLPPPELDAEPRAPVPGSGAPMADPPSGGVGRHVAEAPTWIFETHRVSAAAPTAFDAAPMVHWQSLDRAYDRPLRRLWRALLRLLGIERS